MEKVNGVSLRTRKESSKLLRTRSTGGDLRSVSHVQHKPAIKLLRGNHMIEIYSVRSMNAQKDFRIKTRGEITQPYVNEVPLVF
jgi:hypothetical protein